MEFVIAYFGLLIVGLAELRLAVRDRETRKLRLLLLATLSHLILVLAYLSRLEWPLAGITH
jgi:hypothetical protein